MTSCKRGRLTECALVVLLAGACTPGCFDASPKTPSDANPSRQDGGSDPGVGGDAGVVSAGCRACLDQAHMTACTEEYALCANMGRCLDIYECIVDDGCFGPPVPQVVGCGAPCASVVGITSIDDPVVGAGFPLLECLTDRCGSVCQQPSDAGAP